MYGGNGDVYVLLQRAPTLKVCTGAPSPHRPAGGRSLRVQSKKDEHVDLVSSLVKNYGIGVSLVLASLDAANQDDAQLL